MQVYKTFLAPIEMHDDSAITCLKSVVSMKDPNFSLRDLPDLRTLINAQSGGTQQVVDCIGSENMLQQKIQDIEHTHFKLDMEKLGYDVDIAKRCFSRVQSWDFLLVVQGLIDCLITYMTSSWGFSLHDLNCLMDSWKF